MAKSKPFSLQKETPNNQPMDAKKAQQLNESISFRSEQINSGIERVFMLDPKNIEPNPFQPRKHFNQETLQQLADDIKTDGQLQPILVIDTGSRYVVIAGERRVRACRLLGVEVKAIVERSSEEQLNADSTRLLRVAMMENIKREDLTALERAESLLQLSKTQEYEKLSKAEFARNVGVSYTSLNRLFDILNLTPYIKDKIRKGTSVSLQSLENLSRLDAENANRMFDEIESGNLNNEDAITLIREHKNITKKETKSTKNNSAISDKYYWGSFKSNNKQMTLNISTEKANSDMIQEIKEIIKKYQDGESTTQ